MATLLRILKHRAIIALLALLGLAGALQLAAPPVIRTIAIHWLDDHGAAGAEIGSIHINPFSGTLVVHDLKAGDGLHVGRAAINIDWWPLWSHRIYIWDIALDRATLGLVQDAKARWQVAGLSMPAGAPAAAGEQPHPWHVILHRASLKDVRIRLSGHDLKADIPIQSLNMHHAFLSGPRTQVLNTELQLGRATVEGLGYRLADAGLLLQGQIMLPGPDARSGSIAARHATLRLRGLSVDTLAGRPVLAIGRARIHELALQEPDRIEAADAEADAVQLHTPMAGAADAAIDRIAAHDLRFAAGSLDLAKLNAQNIRATDAPRQISLGSIGDMSLDGLSLKHTRQGGFARLALRDITLPATKAQSMGRIGGITVSDASLTPPRHIQMARLDVRGLNLSLAHTKSGMAVLDRLRPPPTAAAPSPSPPPAGPVDVQIGQLTVDPGSRIAFTDDAVYPPFQGTLEVASLQLAPLALGGKQPSTVDGAFKIGDRGELTVKGGMTLDRADPAAELTIALKRLSMPMLSGYLAKGFGNTIGTGQMDLDSRLRIHNHAVDAKNRLVIRSLTLKATAQPGKASQSIGMPLDMALSMLRDDRGDIALDVPVTGRLDDPNVNIDDAINQALATAIKSGAMSYASLLLQPYGSILPALSLASGVLGYASRPRLTPIAFAPRTATLSDEAKAYIGKIALLLKQKPFRLQACGVASRAEIEAEAPGGQSVDETKNKRLLSLATARSSAVTKELAAAGISPDRIFECQPQIDTKANAAGRVELLLN
ncbi:MAG TPA: DUF748 domain-containing protein [Mariprofundaceae bacterium]|nr:DUF748 domain-containing protein [Mariprofundaceae bacterium]